jgi:hypothetical protein
VNFQIVFTLEQVNVVLLALSKLPYEASAQIIESVRKQAEKQHAEQQEALTPEPATVDAVAN